MNRLFGIVAAAAVGGWLVSTFPAYATGGVGGVIRSSVALMLCWVPNAALCLAYKKEFTKDRRAALLMMGSLLRAAFVLAGGIALYRVPKLQSKDFWIWLVLYYLMFLAVEVAFLVNEKLAANNNG